MRIAFKFPSLILLMGVILLFCSQGCTTAQFNAQWQDDTREWASYVLNGVRLKIPRELPMMKINSQDWWFVISAHQVDNFSHGVSEAIDITCVAEDPKQVDSALKQTRQRINGAGGRTRVVDKPISGVKYFHPDGYVGRQSKTGDMHGTAIIGSSVGYVFSPREGVYVNVSLFKGHERISYDNWNPEREIFSEEERKLLDRIAALAQ